MGLQPRGKRDEGAGLQAATSYLLVPWGLLPLTPSLRKGGQSCIHFPLSLQNCCRNLWLNS